MAANRFFGTRLEPFSQESSVLIFYSFATFYSVTQRLNLMSKIPIRTVHITNYYHKTSGGISTAYNHLLDAANRRRQFVTLIVPGEVEEEVSIGQYGKIYFVKSGHFPLFDRRYRVIVPQMYLSAGSRIREILLVEKPDLIEVCDKYTISWLGAMVRLGKFSALGRPTLVHMSCERMDDNIRAFVTESRLGKQMAKAFMRNLIYPMYDFYAANSSYTLSELQDSVGDAHCRNELGRVSQKLWSLLNGSDEPFSQRAYIHEAGVDATTFNPSRKTAINRSKLIQRLGLKPSDRILLYAGRISPEKNIEILPKIMQCLKIMPQTFKIVVAGDGPQREWLANQLNDVAPDSARFDGHIADKNDLADLYANSDVFIHPNPREPFGIGPLEAMASGTPVVAPRSGGVTSYCNDGNSWLVNDNAGDFTVAINCVFNDALFRNIRVVRARQTAVEYGWENSTDLILANYEKMISYFHEHQMARR